MGAMDGLEAWDGWSPQCVSRVEAVLQKLTGPVLVTDDLAVAGMGRLAEWLGGPGGRVERRAVGRLAEWLGGPGGRFERRSLDWLQSLEVGGVTVVAVDRPGEAPHLVVVERYNE